MTSEDICHPSESRAGHRSATSHLRLARWTTGLGTPFRVRTWPTTLETAAARCSPRPAGLRRFWDTAISATPPSVSPPVRQCSGYLCGKWIFGKVSAFGGPDNDIHVDVVTRQCPVLCPAGHGLEGSRSDFDFHCVNDAVSGGVEDFQVHARSGRPALRVIHDPVDHTVAGGPSEERRLAGAENVPRRNSRLEGCLHGIISLIQAEGRGGSGWTRRWLLTKLIRRRLCNLKLSQ